MSAAIVSAVALAAAAIYWYINRHKPLKHILSELKTNIDMQGAGVGGLIDDWVNIRKNKVVLPDAKLKVAVITGGARGIGREVIRGLLKANMRVVMGIRNPDQAKPLSDTMENGENLCSFKLDLKSMKSVKEFAQKVTEKYPEVHVLVNSAGIMLGDYEITEDGFESQLAVNHLGHFYLTHLLLPALKKSGVVDGPSRVVNVTSCAHYPGKIYFEDINMKEHYDTIAAYSQAKLAQVWNLLIEEDCFKDIINHTILPHHNRFLLLFASCVVYISADVCEVYQQNIGGKQLSCQGFRCPPGHRQHRSL